MAQDTLTHKDLISFAYQVARGMDYLESKKVRKDVLYLTYLFIFYHFTNESVYLFQCFIICFV